MNDSIQDSEFRNDEWAARERESGALLTVRMITDALAEIPAHRTELRRILRDTIPLIERRVPVRDTAPFWKQVQNVIFVNKVDGGADEPESDS